MSELRTGRGCVAHMEKMLRSAEAQLEERAQRTWWRQYAGRLTPEEKKRIRGEGSGQGVYNAFWRQYRPAFKEGDWLPAGPKLLIQIASVHPRNGRYRITIGRARDFRSSGTPVKAFHRSAEGDLEPEPEGVDGAWLSRFATEAREKQAAFVAEAITG